MMNEREKSDSAVSSDETSEQGRATGGGAGGAKGGGQGKRGTGPHAPNGSVGRARPRLWTAYGKPQGCIRRGGSPRSCTTSTSIDSGTRSTP